MDIEELKRRIVPVLRRYEVARASFFGSFARGEATKGSDVDLLVEFEGDKSLLDLAGLKVELEGLLDIRVDVLTYASLHPLLKERILEEAVPVL
jgi:predicted nucleotidyltransferase